MRFRPMRSCAPEDKFPILYPKLASRKIDGIRFVKRDGKAITKSGKPVANNHIRAWIEANIPESVDGEIISGLPNLETTYDTTYKAVMTHSGTPDFTLYVFDMCDSLVEYATERLARLAIAVHGIGRVVIVQQELIYSDEERVALYDSYLAEGYEGMILKDPLGQYKYGRSTARQQTQLKLKPEEDAEAVVLSIYEGMHNANEAFTNDVGETDRSTHAENKVPNGMLGGFYVRILSTGALTKIAPGKMSHADRTAHWKAYKLDPESYHGRLIKYRSMTYGDMVNGAARHGRFYGWRDASDMNPEDMS